MASIMGAPAHSRSRGAAAAAAVGALVTVLVLYAPGANGFQACDVSLFRQLVFPFTSSCLPGASAWGPAVYYGEEVYQLAITSIVGDVAGYLAPELDDTTSTFYVRAASVGAKYAFYHTPSKESRSLLQQSDDDVLIMNSESGRYLGWRDRTPGRAEPLLVEVSMDRAARFQFAGTPFSSLARCNFVDPAITCTAYHILQPPSSTLGLTPISLSTADTYFTLANVTAWRPSFLTTSFQLMTTNSRLAVAAA